MVSFMSTARSIEVWYPVGREARKARLNTHTYGPSNSRHRPPTVVE